MKKYSKSQLQEKGTAIAQEHKVETLFAAENGDFFFAKNKSAAEMFCKEKSLKLYELSFELSEEKTETKKVVKLSAKKVYEAIEKAETLEELETVYKSINKPSGKITTAYETMKGLIEEENAIEEAEKTTEAEKGTEE